MSAMRRALIFGLILLCLTALSCNAPPSLLAEIEKEFQSAGDLNEFPHSTPGPEESHNTGVPLAGKGQISSTTPTAFKPEPSTVTPTSLKEAQPTNDEDRSTPDATTAAPSSEPSLETSPSSSPSATNTAPGELPATGAPPTPTETGEQSTGTHPIPSGIPLPATATPSLAPSPTRTSTQAPPTSSNCAPSGNSGFESSLIALINQERQSRGIAPLTPQSQLTSAARSHSADMACNDFFSHTGSDGSLPWDRIADQGYSYSTIAENIFAGSSSAQTAFNGWMNSPGHRDNMLNSSYSEIGVGYRYWEDSTYGAYVTAVFANPH